MRTKLTLTAAFVALTFGQAAFAANQNLSTDVLVVGAGSAGLTAAVQAAEKGKKVILLETVSYTHLTLPTNSRV